MIANRRLTSGVLAAALLGTSGLSLCANGFRLADQDAFATARGEAFAATADNASAIYYNPAGLSLVQGSDVRGGIYGIYLNPTYTPPSDALNAGTTYHIEKHTAAVPQFFYSYTLETLPLSFGLGAYAPFGGDVSWPQDTGFRTIGTKGSLTYFTINPVVALRLTPTLSIGAGATVNYAKITLEGGLRRRLNPNFSDPDFFNFTGDGWSAGYNVGVLWQPLEQVSLGAAFRSSATMNFEGETTFQRPPTTPLTQRPASMPLTFPLGVVAGISYRPTPKWNLEFDADWMDWSSFSTSTIHQTGPSDGQESVVPMDINQTLNWQASWMFEFGVTRYFEKGWHVSAGYVFNQSSVPDAYYTPLAADLDRHFISVGVGHAGKCIDFDVAYQFGYGGAHTVTGSSPSSLAGVISGQNADGTYDFISQAVMLTVGLRF
jgi:long-chain fatty acid transport protein